jgi:hypothetical protein
MQTLLAPTAVVECKYKSMRIILANHTSCSELLMWQHRTRSTAYHLNTRLLSISDLLCVVKDLGMRQTNLLTCVGRRASRPVRRYQNSGFEHFLLGLDPFQLRRSRKPPSLLPLPRRGRSPPRPEAIVYPWSALLSCIRTIFTSSLTGISRPSPDAGQKLALVACGSTL